MTPEVFFDTYTSDTTAGSSNQVLTRFGEPVTRTGRVSYRLSRGGERYSLLFSNRVDSTYSDGSISKANDKGGEWSILSLRVGLAKATGIHADKWHYVTFDGQPTRNVSAGEGFFCSDPVALNARPGDYFVYEITVRGECFPYHQEMVLNVYSGESEPLPPDKRIPVPLMIGCDRPARVKVGFLGDSITQGCGTAYESYTHWAAVAAGLLPDDVSAWDLGIGYARAYDAASDGLWLERAKKCDVVTVCFGVNDIFHERSAADVVGDLTTIVEKLHEADTRVLLITIPPFDMTGANQGNWYAANDAIRRGGIKADDILDCEPMLGKTPPFGHNARFGGHPDAEGCALLGKEVAKHLAALCGR